MALFFNILIAIIAIILGFVINIIYKELKSKTEYRTKCIEILEEKRLIGFTKNYRKYLEAGLDKLDDILGAPFSAQALTINTSLAIFYAISLFMLSWAFGGSGKLASIVILPETFSIIQRIFTLLFFIVIFLIFIFYEKIDSGIEKFLSKIFPQRLSSWVYCFLAAIIISAIVFYLKNYFIIISMLIIFFSSAIAVSVAFTIAFAGAVPVAFAVAGKGAVTFAFAFSVAVAVSGAASGAVPGESAFAFAFILIILPLIYLSEKSLKWSYIVSLSLIIILFTGLSLEVKFLSLNKFFISYLFFLIILPIINGWLDFSSFFVSRKLARKIVDNKGIKTFIIHFGADFIIAIILLVTLIFGICFCTELFNHFVIKKPDLMINLPNFIETARHNPLGAESLWITLMLFSTLLPTAAHFVLAFFGAYTAFFTPKFIRKNFAARLKDTNTSGIKLILPAIYFSLRYPVSIVFGIGFLCTAGYFISKYCLHFANLLSTVAYWGINAANMLF
jgi:hypothetical protein